MFPSGCVTAGRDGLERGLLPRLDELRGRERACLALDRLDLGRLDAGDSMLLEAARLHEHLAFERADGLVVGIDGTVERASELREMRTHRRQPLVELASEVGD